MKPNADQRPDLATGSESAAPGGGHRPAFETEARAEWRVQDGGLFILRLDRATGAWSGEQQSLDGGGSNPLTPHEVALMARAHDLRFGDGTRAG